MKRTHKFSGLSDVASVVAKAGSISAAAKQLGVQRSTIYRWIESGKVKSPEDAQAPAAKGPETGQTPDEWAAWVRESCVLDQTGEQLLALAVQLLVSAKTEANLRDRLSASAEYRQVVKQLNLQPKVAAERVPDRPAVRRIVGDPRAFLMAVTK